VAVLLRVSVLIPTYNRPDNLSEVLDSILKQTTRPDEVIVVDDHTPTSKIRTVCREHAANFRQMSIDLKYIRNPRERSVNTARNVGVEKSEGDIIFFLDDDMIPFEHFIQGILDIFERYPMALGVQGWMVDRAVYHHPLSEAIRRFFLLFYHTTNSCKYFEYPSTLTKIINCQHLDGGCSAYRREVFSQFRFDENLKKSWNLGDQLFSYSIYQKHPLSLFITPNAKVFHKGSKKGRMTGVRSTRHGYRSRKYVLTGSFGFKGLLIFYWQNLGFFVIDLAIKVWRYFRLLGQRF